MRKMAARAVFGRGGIRGIAMAGAVAAFEAAGYRFERVAGVSAGGVVAALVAAGYRGDALKRVVWELDFAGWLDGRGPRRLPFLGPALNLVTRLGLHDGDALLESLRRLMRARGIERFADLRDDAPGEPSPYRLRVVAADVTRGRLIILPDHAPRYGLDPDRLEVALALRMSASMPLFFRPLTLGAGADASVVVDGGLFAPIPFGLLEERGGGGTPTFGIQPRPPDAGHRPIRGPLSLLLASYYTAIAVNDRCSRSPADAERTVDIDCVGVRATSFGLSDTRKQALYDAGIRATERFLSSWDWDSFRARHGNGSVGAASAYGEARPLRVVAEA